MVEGREYCISAKNIRCHEMIGLRVKVTGKGTDARIEGKVVDEKKNVFVIESYGDEKMVAKKGNMFEFTLGNEKAMVRGNDILYRPEQRIKALWRFC